MNNKHYINRRCGEGTTVHFTRWCTMHTERSGDWPKVIKLVSNPGDHGGRWQRSLEPLRLLLSIGPSLNLWFPIWRSWGRLLRSMSWFEESNSVSSINCPGSKFHVFISQWHGISLEWGSGEFRGPQLWLIHSNHLRSFLRISVLRLHSGPIKFKPLGVSAFFKISQVIIMGCEGPEPLDWLMTIRNW